MILERAERTRQTRRRRRRRRIAGVAAVAAFLGAVVVAAVVTRSSLGESAPRDGAARSTADGAAQGTSTTASSRAPSAAAPSAPAAQRARRPPREIRGVHVTMRLASSSTKLDEYLSLPGVNTLQVDVKDEGGHVAFEPAAVPLARAVRSPGHYYSPWRLARHVHRRSAYLVGRVVTFQDPMLVRGRPDLGLRRADGSVWRNDAGREWSNPYDRRVWKYNVDLAAAACRAGFDEIQFDYVRFPSDGDVSAIVFPGRTATPPAAVIEQFLRYAAARLRPLGVRVSASVFGLSATLDVGVAQVPRLLARHLDAIYPMAYPSHYRPGEYGLSDPNAAPGETVAATLRDFRRELRGRRTAIVPWLQDFSLGRRYGLDDVGAQIDAARAGGAAGFLLWNPHGVYSPGALAWRTAAR